MASIEELEEAGITSSKPSVTSGLTLLYEPDLEQFNRDTLNDPNNIEDAWITHHGRYAHQGVLVARSSFQYNEYKDKLEKLEALLDAKYRDQLIAEGAKPTEKAIDALIKADRSWGALSKLVNTAKMYADIHKTNLTALEHRKDMLMQMGAQMRREMDGQMRTTMPGGTEVQRTAMQEKLRSNFSTHN